MEHHARRRARLLRSSVALALALAAAACGGSDAGGDASDGGGGEGELDRSGELVFSASFPTTVDPHRSDGGNRITSLYLSYDRLIHLTPEGEFAPGLATEWEVAPDGMSMELQLREGVVFHDGTPFNAEAVQASLERAKAFEDASPLVAARSQLIAAVQPIDDLSVRLEFSEAYHAVAYDLATQLGAMISPTALESGVDLDQEDAGAGPYRMVSWRPGEVAQFERFEDYWDPDANPLAEVEIRSLPNAETRFNAVQSGQADIVELETRQAADAEAAGLVVNNFDTQGAYMMSVNADLLPEWEDVDVRRAVQHAIDRPGLVEAITEGLAEPAVQPFGSANPVYNPDFPGDHYEYDPERARELLADAGAEDLRISVMILNRPIDIAIAEALQSSFAEAGITLELEVTEPQNYTQFTQGHRQALLGTWSGRLNAVDTLLEVYMPNGLLNPSSWADPEVQELFEQAASMPLGDERDEVLRDAFGLVAERAAGATLISYVASWTTSDCVVGFEPYVTTAPDLRGVGLREGCS